MHDEIDQTRRYGVYGVFLFFFDQFKKKGKTNNNGVFPSGLTFVRCYPWV